MRGHGPGGIWRSFVGLAEIADIADIADILQRTADCGKLRQIAVDNGRLWWKIGGRVQGVTGVSHDIKRV